ncbi:LADA_0B02762g1_1 [Lachancea dasiensis]|uniref:Altered inheritance of mitochondria protein 32 n=1 Tax=Lachancea dasiensis TaxID=1072105 RepID=A0A1G4ISN6_9SACH|nr:LADA_0B02762g1_1 [Lachancea dasiensis]
MFWSISRRRCRYPVSFRAHLHTEYRHVTLQLNHKIQQNCDCYVTDLNEKLDSESQLDIELSLPAKTPEYHKHLMLVSPPDSAGSEPEWKGSWQSQLELNPRWPYSAIAQLKGYLKDTHRGSGVLINAISMARSETIGTSGTGKKARFLAVPDMKTYDVGADELEEFATFLGEGKIGSHHKISFADFLGGANAISKVLQAQTDPQKGSPYRKFEGQDHRKDIVLVCGHHQRDARCGLIAPALIEELKDRVESDLAIVSHIGGHKFAGNVIFYKYLGTNQDQTAKVDGLWFGKILPATVATLVENLKQNNIVTQWFRGGAQL